MAKACWVIFVDTSKKNKQDIQGALTPEEIGKVRV